MKKYTYFFFLHCPLIMILFLSRSLSLSAQGCVGRAGWGATWCVRTAMGRWSLTVSVIQTSSRWPFIRAEIKTAPPTGWSKSGSRWAARLHCTNEAFMKGSFNDSPPAMCLRAYFIVSNSVMPRVGAGWRGGRWCVPGWSLVCLKSSQSGCVTGPSDLRTVQPVLRDPAPSGSPRPGRRLGADLTADISLVWVIKIFCASELKFYSSPQFLKDLRTGQCA